MARLAWYVIGLSVIVGCARSEQPDATIVQRDEDQIRTLFHRYHQALRNQDGEQAVACLDQATLDWYDALRRDALHLPRAELARQDLHRRLSLLLMRHEFNRETLAESPGPRLLAQGVRKGWLEAPGPVSLVHIGVTGQTAYATTPQSGQIPVFFFHKEEAGWKVNLTKSRGAGRRALEMLWEKAKADGQTEEEFLKTRLQEFSERPVNERIFDGPLEKEVAR